MSRNTKQFDDSRASGQCCVTASLWPGASFVLGAAAATREVVVCSAIYAPAGSIPARVTGIGGRCGEPPLNKPGLREMDKKADSQHTPSGRIAAFEAGDRRGVESVANPGTQTLRVAAWGVPRMAENSRQNTTRARVSRCTGPLKRYRSGPEDGTRRAFLER